MDDLLDLLVPIIVFFGIIFSSILFYSLITEEQPKTEYQLLCEQSNGYYVKETKFCDYEVNK